MSLAAPRPAEDEPASGPRLSLSGLLEEGAHDRTTDWGSLLADLSRDAENPRLRIHDKTHLEISIDYDLPAEGDARHEWEAYFFAPESLRLDSRTYGKDDLYEDLQSYVRFAVPSTTFHALAGEPLDRVERALGGSEHEATRELRLFVCQLRAAGVTAKRAVVRGLDGAPAERERGFALADAMIADARAIAGRLHALLAPTPSRVDPLATACAWVDEDASRLLETLFANLVLDLRKADAPAPLVERVQAVAVDEARYRDDAGHGGVGHIGMGRRAIEGLEFRRHVLKRYTSSVLWLRPEVRPASEWVLHLLNAVAASVAMTFALLAALYNGNEASGSVVRWVLVAVVAYAAKDRIKALLQSKFANVVSRHFPDRSWRILDKARGQELGAMEEQSGFVSFASVPRDVLEVRRATRRHALEEEARPETVLFHRKEVEVHRDVVSRIDPRFDALSEILRLDLRRWLAHTDDPEREFVFADPQAGVVGSAVAPRVYNLALVYRLRKAGDAQAPWHRARVVVTRKGIRRVDLIH